MGGVAVGFIADQEVALAEGGEGFAELVGLLVLAVEARGTAEADVEAVVAALAAVDEGAGVEGLGGELKLAVVVALGVDGGDGGAGGYPVVGSIAAVKPSMGRLACSGAMPR